MGSHCTEISRPSIDVIEVDVGTYDTSDSIT